MSEPIVRKDAEGVEWVYDPLTGESAIYYPNGNYFRSWHDYDHGWVWEKPGMGYGQLRRSTTSIFFNRASMLFLGFIVAIFWPLIMTNALSGIVGGNILGLTAIFTALASVGTGIVIKYARTDTFDYAWHGRLHTPEPDHLTTT